MSTQGERRVSNEAHPMFVFVAKTPSGDRKVFQIIFSKKDGSVYVRVPYFTAPRGFLGDVARRTGSDGESIFDYKTSGHETTKQVKLSIHASGQCHFEADGMETALVRKTTPLENFSGPLFSVQVSGLRQFTRFTDKDRRKRRGHRFHVGMRFASADSAFMLNARWHRKQELLDRSPEQEIKWLVKYRRGDEEKVGAIIGAPPGFPFDDRVIIVSPETPSLHPAEPHYLLMGGFDPEPSYHDPSAPYGYLLAAYPRDVMADLPPNLPTHDYPNPTDVEVIGDAEA